MVKTRVQGILKDITLTSQTTFTYNPQINLKTWDMILSPLVDMVTDCNKHAKAHHLFSASYVIFV